MAHIEAEAFSATSSATALYDKDLKKWEMKEVMASHAAELARKKDLHDNYDAFMVVIGNHASGLDDENGSESMADANMWDIAIENFLVSAWSKELLKSTSVKISYGKRYGLVGSNGMGKSTLLKLLIWRKIPVAHNIDVLLVE